MNQALQTLKRTPILVKAGAGCGAVAGVSIGLVVSTPFGIVAGLSLGAIIGTIAGTVMDHDDQRSSQRTRQLDDIIGVTEGSLGTTAPIEEDPLIAEEGRSSEVELRAWVTEWMTPPTPRVG